MTFAHGCQNGSAGHAAASVKLIEEGHEEARCKVSKLGRKEAGLNSQVLLHGVRAVEQECGADGGPRE